MKVFAALFAFLGVASAFAPMPTGRVNTQLSESFFDKVFGMDLFEPVKNQNEYGQYKNKGLKVGALSSRSYVPQGLSKADYQKVRDADQKKKDANYAKNAKKAGKFLDFTDYYIKRGTDTSQAWYKSPSRGHTLAKTKYDFDTSKDGKKYDGTN